MRSLLLSLCLVFTVSIFAATDVTVYCDDAYAPYSYKENGKVKGIYVDILKKAFSKMKDYNVKIEAVPWKRGLSYLERGTGFALFPPYYHPEKRPYMSPYSEPILDENVAVFCREEILTKPRPDWPEDYYGLRVGNNAGFQIRSEKFWKAVKEGKLKLDEAKGTDKNILKLATKKIDCYANDRLSILWEIKKLKESGKYDEGGKHSRIVESVIVSTEKGYIGFTNKDKGKFGFKDDFLAKINKIIKNMKASGEIDKIIKNYIK